ncbi:hypothetical protein [Nonomuraea sp. NPDC049504]|uniref:hypothetical protein n=1 Tax=Nonomuraea sp. NPDC049504 TaxID=3154729 RepID=UPI00343FA289
MNEELVAERMSAFGMRFLGLKRGTGIPTRLTGVVTCAGGNDGRHDRIISLEDEDRVTRFNAEWYELATEYKLLSADRQFLVALTPAIDPVFAQAREATDDWEDPAWWEYTWGLVELEESWDIAGAGAASGVLGSTYGEPAFVMSSLDGSVFVAGTRWEDSIGVAVVPEPYRSSTLRKLARRNLDVGRITEEEEKDLRVWLAVDH